MGCSHAPGREYCPARRAECHKCHKKGHFAQVCRTKGVREVTEKSDHPTYFLGVSFLQRFRTGMEGDSGNTRGPGQLQTRFRCRCYCHSGGDTEPDETQAEAEACLHQTESPGGQLACLGQVVARSIIDGQPLHYRYIVAKTTDNLLSRSVAVKMGFMKRVYVDEIQDVYGDIGILQCDSVMI